MNLIKKIFGTVEQYDKEVDYFVELMTKRQEKINYLEGYYQRFAHIPFQEIEKDIKLSIHLKAVSKEMCKRGLTIDEFAECFKPVEKNVNLLRY